MKKNVITNVIMLNDVIAHISVSDDGQAFGEQSGVTGFRFTKGWLHHFLAFNMLTR